MSSVVVREKFKAALQSLFPAVPYYDVYGVNLDNDDLESTWVTLEFAVNVEERISIGMPSYWHETGSCRVIVVSIAGQGDTIAVALGDQIKDAFRNWYDQSSGIRVLNVVPPSAAAPVSEGKWLGVIVELSYQREFFA